MIQRIELPNTVLNVQDVGRGDPLVFVHGFPLDHAMWHAQVEHFSKTHRCLAVDLRGFGKSDVSPGTVSMASMADDLSTLLDVLRIVRPVTLCGLSMGGYVAWQFWHRHARKLARLILCDTRAIADTAEGRVQRLATADRVEAEGTDFLADAMLPNLFSVHTFQQHPEQIELAKATIAANSAQGIAAAARGMAARPDVTDWLQKITLPVLLVTGQEDAISTVAEMAGLAEKLPNATHAIIQGAGHMAPQEQPKAVNRAIETFLQSTAKTY